MNVEIHQFRVVEYTNLELAQLSKRVKRSSSQYLNNLYPTNENEILGLFGLWIHLGVNGFHGIPVPENFFFNRKFSRIFFNINFSKSKSSTYIQNFYTKM